MHIYVCIKHVPDTAANIRPLGKTKFDETVKFIANPYDENALEEAIKIRERGAGVDVVAVTIGSAAAVSTLRMALAMGADRAIHIRTDEYFTDTIETGRLLQRAISEQGPPDLILTGRQSVDTEGMQVPYRLGILFDMPVAVNVVAFSMSDGLVTVEREIDGDKREVIEMRMPCIVGAAKGLNRPRCPTLPDMMKAKKMEILTIPVADLGPPISEASMTLLELQTVPDRSRGQMLQGSPEVMARELLRILRENKTL
jgi:electron transfer flavoprotein beta subunit